MNPKQIRPSEETAGRLVSATFGAFELPTPRKPVRGRGNAEPKANRAKTSVKTRSVKKKA